MEQVSSSTEDSSSSTSQHICTIKDSNSLTISFSNVKLCQLCSSVFAGHGPLIDHQQVIHISNTDKTGGGTGLIQNYYHKKEQQEVVMKDVGNGMNNIKVISKKGTDSEAAFSGYIQIHYY